MDTNFKITMSIKDPEMYLEAPLLVVAFIILTTGIGLIESNLPVGVGLVALSVLIVILEKYIEREDAKKKADNSKE